ncbi:MAG: TraM recognition domain-containing protein [Bdellovibrionales bacterium]|nr:TraM recognition domain-containing protein [Bdellovibrionales bacterium]
MARDYVSDNFTTQLATRRHNMTVGGLGAFFAALLFCASGLAGNLTPLSLMVLGALVPCSALFVVALAVSSHRWVEGERGRESGRRGGKPVLGLPPRRTAFDDALKECRARERSIIDRYLVGFELDSGEPIWVTDDEICGHGAVFAKTGVGKTLWLEGLMFQQMARGRASGFTFIDAKRDPGTLADIIMMALITGRIEDVIVVDPFDPVCAYNFVFTTQRPDVKARKVLRCGLPPTSDQSTTKHYDRLAADAVYRVVRAMESLGLAWSVRDIAVALSAFIVAYPRMRELLHEQGAKQAMVELGHLASSYRTAKGSLDSARLTDNLRGIASELHSIANSEAGEMFCVPRADLSLTDAILRGKLIYYMLPRLEEAESAARMVKVFREDLEVSIGEITSSRTHRLEDPHLVIIDEGASTFGPTWANLFELARKGRFALLFGAQSIGGLMDQAMGLSQEFYERVIANVNLKVIMRLGDNRTAEDMSEWIGMVNTTKKTIATGVSTSLNARELTKHIEFNRRTADGIRDGFTFAEDEKALVSAEELKHEMSAEKGLAWFDKGDGRLRKGRAIWFDAELPATWEGREYLTRYESVEADEIGLAEWVDEHILSIERQEALRRSDHAHHSPGESAHETSNEKPEPAEDTPAEGGTFRLNLLKGFRGMGRSRTTLTAQKDPPASATAATATPSATDSEAPSTTQEQDRSQESSATAPSAPGSVNEAESSKPSETTPTSKPTPTRFAAKRGATPASAPPQSVQPPPPSKTAPDAQAPGGAFRANANGRDAIVFKAPEPVRRPPEGVAESTEKSEASGNKKRKRKRKRSSSKAAEGPVRSDENASRKEENLSRKKDPKDTIAATDHHK